MKILKNAMALPSLVLLFGTSTHSLAEPHPGKALHESGDCMRCHTAKPYNPNKTTSFEQLIERVQFCNDNLNAGMFEDEVEQLADYLNDTYYHMPK